MNPMNARLRAGRFSLITMLLGNPKIGEATSNKAKTPIPWNNPMRMADPKSSIYFPKLDNFIWMSPRPHSSVTNI